MTGGAAAAATSAPGEPRAPEAPALAAAAPAPLIRLLDAGVRFGDVVALDGVRVDIARGERIALVGANGAGKTTLLRLLDGLVAPTSGRRLAPAGPDGRRPVTAMVFQRPFVLDFSAATNVALALWLAGVRGRAERARRTAEALERVGLGAQARRAARALSGGQQQRLALARAWAVRPDALFLDEPTASLDPGAKREVEALIDDFAGDGVTLVMSSHNLGQVKRLARRVLFLDGGRLLADRPCDAFFADAPGAAALPEAARRFLHAELPWPRAEPAVAEASGPPGALDPLGASGPPSVARPPIP